MSWTTVFAVALAVVLLAVYISWTAGRLDRLHARVDAAWAALDEQLVRRAAAARALADALPPGPTTDALHDAAAVALEAGPTGRERVENDLSRALRAAVAAAGERPAAAPVLAELETATNRVGLARAFHNDAVKNTRAIRLRWLPRALRLAGHRELPSYFEIDDTAPVPRAVARDGVTHDDGDAPVGGTGAGTSRT